MNKDQELINRLKDSYSLDPNPDFVSRAENHLRLAARKMEKRNSVRRLAVTAVSVVCCSTALIWIFFFNGKEILIDKTSPLTESPSASDNKGVQTAKPKEDFTSEKNSPNDVAKDTDTESKESSSDDQNIVHYNMANSPFEKGYYDYEGTIGEDIPIQLSIYPFTDEIMGTYFYESQGEDLKLKGSADAKDIILYEYDKTGNQTGTFTGTLNGVDQIAGTWTSADKKTSYPFTLTLKAIAVGAEYGKRYADATSYMSDQEVENSARIIQDYLKTNQKESLAELIHYPINVKINNKIARIINKDDFLRHYDEIFYPEFKQEILQDFPKNMFSNWMGIMLGGEMFTLWMQEETLKDGTRGLVITAINN